MLLRLGLGMADEAGVIENAVRAVLRAGFRTVDIMEDGMTAVGCARMGELVAQQI